MYEIKEAELIQTTRKCLNSYVKKKQDKRVFWINTDNEKNMCILHMRSHSGNRKPVWRINTDNEKTGAMHVRSLCSELIQTMRKLLSDVYEKSHSDHKKSVLKISVSQMVGHDLAPRHQSQTQVSSSQEKHHTPH